MKGSSSSSSSPRISAFIILHSRSANIRMYSSRMGVDMTGRSRSILPGRYACDGGPEKSSAEYHGKAHHQLFSPKHRSGIIFGQAAAQTLLFGQVIGIVQGSQIRDPFFSLFATIGIDDLNAESCRQRIQKIHHAVLVILA
jgi:hypothetical protein